MVHGGTYGYSGPWKKPPRLRKSREFSEKEGHATKERISQTFNNEIFNDVKWLDLKILSYIYSILQFVTNFSSKF